MIKKKLLCTFISAAMVAGIAGCGKDNSGKTTEKTDSETTIAVTTTSDNTESTEKTDATTEEGNSGSETQGSDLIYQGDRKPLPDGMDGDSLATIISDNRGNEENEINEIFAINKDGSKKISCGSASEWTDEMVEGEVTQLLKFLGISEEAVQFGAYSISLINQRAYGIAAFMPADTMDSDILNALVSYKNNTMDSMQYYMEDQYDIAKKAYIEQLPNGIIILIMCEDEQDFYNQVVPLLQ